MNLTVNFDGSITVSDIVDGQRVKVVYQGFNETECKRLFKSHIKNCFKK